MAGSEDNKRPGFTVNNIQGWELIMTEFECGTWFPGILEVVESRAGVMGCIKCHLHN